MTTVDFVKNNYPSLWDYFETTMMNRGTDSSVLWALESSNSCKQEIIEAYFQDNTLENIQNGTRNVKLSYALATLTHFITNPQMTSAIIALISADEVTVSDIAYDKCCIIRANIYEMIRAEIDEVWRAVKSEVEYNQAREASNE